MSLSLPRATTAVGSCCLEGCVHQHLVSCLQILCWHLEINLGCQPWSFSSQMCLELLESVSMHCLPCWRKIWSKTSGIQKPIHQKCCYTHLPPQQDYVLCVDKPPVQPQHQGCSSLAIPMHELGPSLLLHFPHTWATKQSLPTID